MKLRRWTLSLSLLLLAAPAAADYTLSESASPFSTPTISGRSILMAQIGGRSGTSKETPDVDLPQVEVIDPKKAMLYSLLIPGLGQQAAGRKERARVFYAIEAGIWTSFAIFQVQGSEREDRYIEFAQLTAGVDPSGKNDDYWRTVAQYERSDPGPGSANEFIRRQARALYPGDPDAQQQYLDDNGYFEGDAWDWQNADNLEKYQSLRTKSLDSYDKAELSIFAAIANRVVSVIDAARVAVQANRAAAASPTGNAKPPGSSIGSFGFKLQKDGHDRVPMLTWKTRF